MQRNIKSCRRCSAIGYSCPAAPLAHVGKDYDGTVLIGESPHPSWLETGSPYHSKEGKLTPSAKRIFEYLELLGKTSENIALLEAAKCVVLDRKDLSKMIENCGEHLETQIEEYKPWVIISFGKVVSDSLGKLFKQGVSPCNIYNFERFKYIPLYHPSPANPVGHKKNLEFIQRLLLNRELESEWKK